MPLFAKWCAHGPPILGSDRPIGYGFGFESRGMAAVRLRNVQMLMFFKTSLSVLVLVFNPCTDKMVDTA